MCSLRSVALVIVLVAAASNQVVFCSDVATDAQTEDQNSAADKLASMLDGPVAEALKQFGGLDAVLPMVKQFGGVDKIKDMLKDDMMASMAANLLGGDREQLRSLMDNQELMDALNSAVEQGSNKKASSDHNDDAKQQGSGSALDKDGMMGMLNDPQMMEFANNMLKGEGLGDLFGEGGLDDLLKNFDLGSLLQGDGLNNMMKQMMDPNGPLSSLLGNDMKDLMKDFGGQDMEQMMANFMQGDMGDMMKNFLGGDMGDMGKMMEGLMGGDMGDMMKNLMGGDMESMMKGMNLDNVLGKLDAPPQKKVVDTAPLKQQIPDLDEFRAMVDKLGGLDKVGEMMVSMGMGDMLEKAGGLDALAIMLAQAGQETQPQGGTDDTNDQTQQQADDTTAPPPPDAGKSTHTEL